MDAAHHRLRRPAARRPRPARLARADQADAAQLDRAQRRAPGSTSRSPSAAPASRCSPPDPTRCSAPPTWCWPPSTRWSTSSSPTPGPTARPTRGRAAAVRRPPQAVAGYRPPPADGPSSTPDRGAGQDRRVHRRVRHQPGQRRADPDLRRRLRADGLRHRRDHGRARPGPARLGLRRAVRPADRPARSQPPPTASDGEAVPGRRVRRSTAASSTAWASPSAKARDHRLAEAEGTGRGHGPVQAAGLAVQPPALLGRAVPDRLRRRRPAACAARVDAAGRAARPMDDFAPDDVRTTRTPSPSRRWAARPSGSTVDARPRRRAAGRTAAS